MKNGGILEKIFSKMENYDTIIQKYEIIFEMSKIL